MIQYINYPWALNSFREFFYKTVIANVKFVIEFWKETYIEWRNPMGTYQCVQVSYHMMDHSYFNKSLMITWNQKLF